MQIWVKKTEDANFDEKNVVTTSHEVRHSDPGDSVIEHGIPEVRSTSPRGLVGVLQASEYVAKLANPHTPPGLTSKIAVVGRV